MTAPGCLNAALFGGKPPLAKSFVTSKLSSANSSSYSFPGSSIGSLPWIIVGADCLEVAVTGITIGGVAMALISEHAADKQSFWRLPNPSPGGTADIVVTTGGSVSCAIGIWNISSAPGLWTPYDTLFLASGGSGALDVPAGGVAFGIGGDSDTGADTWSAGLVLDFTGPTDSNSASGASMQSATDQLGMTVTNDLSRGSYIISLAP